MPTHPPPLLLLEMGEPAPDVRARHGAQSDWFRAAIGPGVEMCTVRPFLGDELPPLGSFTAAIISGSSSMVTDRADWSERAACWVHEAVRTGLAVFGVCYGHQLMAHALGGEVGYLPAGREMGSFTIALNEGAESDPLLVGVPTLFDAILTHRQTVLTVPPGAVVLGRSELDPHQIIRFGPKAVSVQFHPEFTPELIRAYIRARAEHLGAEGLDVRRLLARVRHAPVARRILRNFVQAAFRPQAGV